MGPTESASLAESPAAESPAAESPAAESEGGGLLTRETVVPTIGYSRGFPYVIAQPFPVLSDDLLQDDGDQVFAVRNHQISGVAPTNGPVGTLHLFSRQDDGTLVSTASIELDFDARELILTEQSILIAGSIARDPNGSRSDQTVLMSISRDDTTQTSKQTFDGLYLAAARKDDRLFVSSSNRQFFGLPPAVYNFNDFSVSVFDLSTGEPSFVARGSVPTAVTENMIVGDDLVMVARNPTAYPLPAPRDENSMPVVVNSQLTPINGRQNLVRYRIDGDSIERVAELNLFADFNLQMEVAADGKSAVVVGQHQIATVAEIGIDPVSSILVSLIDLSEDQPRLFEVIPITTGRHVGITEIGQRTLVMSDGRGDLVAVDMNQSIDIVAQNRVRRIEMPKRPEGELSQISSITEINANTFAIVRRSYGTDPTSEILDLTPQQEVLTLSIDDGSVTGAQTTWGSDLAVFANDATVPTVISSMTHYGERTPQVLVVGSLDESGKFSQTGTVDLAGSLEIDVDEVRLQLRQIDRIVEHLWEDIENPIVTPLGELLPEPAAVDDVFERNGDFRDPYLNVLANDELADYFGAEPARIIDLIDAPEGLAIAPGETTLRMSEDLMNTDGTFEFQYVLRQGAHRSTGKVSLTLFRYDSVDIRRAVDRIIDQAAIDLGIERSDISVGSPLAFTEQKMTSQVARGIENPLAGRFGVIVDLVVGDELHRYAADFGNDVARLNSRTLETIMELRLKAVDDDGKSVEWIRSGDEFFIEVIAKDLRRFGLGVFGVAFDLALPASKVELTGQVELLGAFDDFGTPITDDGIDDFQAVELIFDHPGAKDQPVVRFGVRALAGGEVNLQLDPADAPGAELLIRGSDEVVSPLEVDFQSLTLMIDGIEPTDTDASGAVTPLDALRVINFLSRFGSVLVDDLETIATSGEAEDTSARLTAMRRLDTNADGQISAQDALAVINRLARTFGPTTPNPTPDPAAVDASVQSDFLTKDDEGALAESL
jgi:hypothetical protein